MDKNVIAYRRLEKSNVDFALEVFNFVKTLPKCVTLSLDIKGFYDNLDFGVLKKAWKDNLGVTDLPEDHYSILKSITKYAYVRVREITKLKKASFENNPKIRFVLDGKVLNWLRSNNKIKQNKLTGIPQGTPISCTLSNLYMLNFDKVVVEKVNSFGGLYRRYSDDILVVCPSEEALKDLEVLIKAEIDSLELKIQETKTEKRYFENTTDGIICQDEHGKPSKLQYLGVNLDSKTISLRHKGYAKFERKMRNAILVKMRQARKNKTKFFKRKIYEKYSPLGKNNYTSYALRASEKLGSSIIEAQVGFHRIMKKISKKILKARRKKIRSSK